ncbi:MAG TPA: AAA family ATPase, partial [Caldilineaceae bacterium]|nr:AAA family ATPase [Caldilineaceae bacterium]
FRDLSWFRRSDAPIFFGRGHQIRELYSAVTDHTAAPLVLFYGQSGVGKSSLLDAGLLPRLEQAHSVVYMRRDQEHGLLGTLLANLPGKAHVPDLAPAGWRTAEQQANKPVTLILDQVEEHFTRPNPALPQELEQFLTALNAIFGDRSQRPQGKLILSFRKEWLAEIEKQLSERGLPFDKIFLERLDEAGVIEAVSGVARRPALQRTYSLSVEEGLATEIANDLLKDRTAPVAPMLQILLTRLWEEATQRDRAKPCFDRTLYDQLRRDGLRLYEFLDRQLERLRQQQQEVVESGLALDLLSFHTTPLGTAEQHEYTALQREYHHRADSLPTLLQHFQNLYLLVDPANDQANSTLQSRLAHDTLAPLVRARFDESDLPGQRARRILESRAGEWDGVDDPSSPTPLDRQDLSVVEAGATGMRAWREAEERLVAASRLARQQLEQRERLIRRLFWGAAMAILLAAGAAGWQWQVASHNAATANAESTRADQNAQDASRQKETAQAEATRALNAETTAEAEAIRARQAQADAEHEAALARSRQLAAQSASELANHQYEPALLLAIEAGSAADTVEAFAAIRTALEQPARIVRLFPGHADWVNAIDWNRDRTRFLTASRDGTARLWDIQSGAELVQVKSVYDSPERILWSPDERSFVTLGASYGSTLQLWDAIDGNERFALVREGISDVQWSTNGRTLLTASVDGTIRSYAADDGSLRTTIPVSPTPVDSARWNQTETRILSVSADGVARLWNAATGRLIATLSGDQQNWIRQALWGPAGGQLLTSSNHGDIAVWGAEAGQQLFTLANDEGAQRVAAWRPDGTEILTGSYSGTIAIWDASTGIQLHIAQPNGRRVRHVAWNRTGTRFLTTGGDGVQVWERDGDTPLLQLATEDGWALADWNESEEIIYTIGSRQAQVWNAETGAAYLPPGSEAEL